MSRKISLTLRLLVPLALVIAITAGLTMASAAGHDVTYDFNGLAGSDAAHGTNPNGQDNWTSEGFIFNVPNAAWYNGVTATRGFDGTQSLVFERVGAGYGADASRVNNGAFSLPAFTGAAGVLEADFGVGFWGNQFALGHDTGDGKIRRSGPSEIGPQLNIGCNSPLVGVQVIDAAGVGSKVPIGNVNAGCGHWVRLRLVMDFAANGGQGSGNLYFKNLTNGDTSFAKVSGLQGVNLGLNPAGLDATNPANWNAMWTHMEGATNQLDNIRAYSGPTCNDLPATIIGTNGNDWLSGTGGVDVIVGLDGDDYIEGFGGDDVLCGNDGDDEIWGDGGNDWISGGNGEDRILGNGGNDEIHGGDDMDDIDGNNGEDTIWGDGGNDWISGGKHNDNILGGPGEDSLDGNGGHDVIHGGADADEIYGGPGDDYIHGNGGDDFIDGETGNDQIHGDADDDRIIGNKGDDIIDGGSGEDDINGSQGHDTIHGGPDDDWLDGGNGNDHIGGGSGNDFLGGYDGDDYLHGDGDDDTLEGHGGDDDLDGGLGTDDLDGGGGGESAGDACIDDGTDALANCEIIVV